MFRYVGGREYNLVEGEQDVKGQNSDLIRGDRGGVRAR
jgi:hypothetical protein